MADEVHDVEGYVICEQGSHWVLREIARRTGGLCPECFQRAGGQRLRTIEVVGAGARISVPVNRRRRPRPTTDARRRSKRAAERARERARKRLAHMFPDLYDIVLADERARAGLNPWTIDRVVTDHGDPDGEIALGFAELDLALEREGVES
jgi:hypothetical protein